MPTGKSSKITQRELPRRRAVTPGSRPQRHGSVQTTSDARRNRREGRRCVSSKPITTTQGGSASWVAPSFEASSQAAEGQLAQIHARRSAPHEKRLPAPERSLRHRRDLPSVPNGQGALAEGGATQGPEQQKRPAIEPDGGAQSPALHGASHRWGARRPGTSPGDMVKGKPAGDAPPREAGARAPGPRTERGPRHHPGDGALGTQMPLVGQRRPALPRTTPQYHRR